MTAVLAVLGVALFSATPVVRWCSVTWADVRPECFVTCSDRTACAADKPECRSAVASRAATTRAACTADDMAGAYDGTPSGCVTASTCSATSGADAVTADTPASQTPASGKRAFCVDGLAGGPGEPGPMLDIQAAPAKAKALVPPVAPRLQPLTVHRVLAVTSVAPRPPNRPGALPPSPRAPPRNVFLQSVY